MTKHEPESTSNMDAENSKDKKQWWSQLVKRRKEGEGWKRITQGFPLRKHKSNDLHPPTSSEIELKVAAPIKRGESTSRNKSVTTRGGQSLPARAEPNSNRNNDAARLPGRIVSAIRVFRAPHPLNIDIDPEPLTPRPGIYGREPSLVDPDEKLTSRLSNQSPLDEEDWFERSSEPKVRTQLEIVYYVSRDRYALKLRQIFLGDEIIQRFLGSFRGYTTVKPDRLEKEICRTLEGFFQELKDEAENVYDQAATDFGSFLVTDLAHDLVETALIEHGTPPLNCYGNWFAIEHGRISNLQLLAIGGEQDFTSFQIFLKDSEAFKNLRSVADAATHQPQPPRLKTVAPRSPVQEPQLLQGTTINFLHDNVELTRITKLASRVPRDMFTRVLIELGQYLGLLRPNCPEDKQRLQWTCKCGISGFDDIQELSPGGIDRLKDRLGSFRINVVSQTQWSSTVVERVRTLATPLLKLQAWVVGLLAISSETSTLPTHHAGPELVARANLESQMPPRQDVELLMCCVPKGKHGKRLHQDELPSLRSDPGLLMHFKKIYSKRRSKIRSIFTLRELRALDLIKFQLFTRDVVDIIPHEVGCRDTSCECVPPMYMIEQYGSSQPQYRCQPVPPDTAPPFPPSLLMHLFNEPGCIDSDQTCILEQIPKRICGELRGFPSKPTDGWGIYFQEGWSVKRIVWLVLILFVLSSLVFGISWTLTKGDIQGAFGVASWLVTLGAIVLTLVVLHASDG